jgi:hypothetical protein
MDPLLLKVMLFVIYEIFILPEDFPITRSTDLD